MLHPATSHLICLRCSSPQPEPLSLPEDLGSRAYRSTSVDRQNGCSSRISSHHVERFERNKTIFAKYGFEPPESDWPMETKDSPERVERRVRMRIRFFCHHCNTLYGTSKQCAHCAHRRCNQCVRQPPKRPVPRVRLAAADAARARYATSVENLGSGSRMALQSSQTQPPASVRRAFALAQSVATNGMDPNENITMGMTSQDEFALGGSGQQSPEYHHTRINKRTRMRVHHTCHVCQRPFTHGDHICAGCGHERCDECPRVPPSETRPPAPGPEPSVKTAETRTSFFGSESDDAGPGPGRNIPDSLLGKTDNASAGDTAIS